MGIMMRWLSLFLILGPCATCLADSPAVAPLYHEALRPQFHFTARQWTHYERNPGQHHEGWMNDPNGLAPLAARARSPSLR